MAVVTRLFAPEFDFTCMNARPREHFLLRSSICIYGPWTSGERNYSTISGTG